jgi:hypothetical protein
MGTKKISELAALTELNDDDLVVIVDSTNESTKKMTVGNLVKQLKKKNAWTKIIELSNNTAAEINQSIEVENIEDYSELLITVGQDTNTERVLSSTVVPMEAFAIRDTTHGYHQVIHYSTGTWEPRGGISNLGNNIVKVYVGIDSGLRVYAR